MSKRNLFNIVENARINREIDEYAVPRAWALMSEKMGGEKEVKGSRIDFNPEWLQPKGAEPYPQDEYPTEHHDDEDNTLLIIVAADFAVTIGCFIIVVAIAMGILP